MKSIVKNLTQLMFVFSASASKTGRQPDVYMRTLWGSLVLCIISVSVTVAQAKSDLPPSISELVPPGTVLISQNFTGSPAMAVAEFTAEKSVAQGRKVEYKLQVRAFDNSSPSWKMREPAYRKQVESRIESKRTGLVSETANQGMHTADLVTETKSSWGSALTQRVTNHPPQASQYVTYHCAYLGMTGGIVFELYVSNLPDSQQEGDKWAQTVIEHLGNLTVSNIGN